MMASLPSTGAGSDRDAPVEDIPIMCPAIPLWWWQPSMSRIRICAPSPVDPKRPERLEKLRLLKPGKSCMRMTDMPPSQHRVRMETKFSTVLGKSARGELESVKVFKLEDPDVRMDAISHDRVPGAAPPTRLDDKPAWKAIADGTDFNRVQNIALARQGAILLVNELAEDPNVPNRERILKWPVIRVGDVKYKY